MPKKYQTLDTTNMNNHSVELLNLRKLYGWSQARLAKEWDVAPGTIALWETGKRSLPGPARKLLFLYSNKLVQISEINDV
jgi:DNA-binding transcriptional regulator YiaG